MTPKQFVIALKKHGSIKAVNRATGFGWKQTLAVYHRAVAEGLMEPLPMGRKSREAILNPVRELKPSMKTGRVKALLTRKLKVPEPGTVRRFIFTCAQNNTKLHAKLWQNLLALKSYYKAELHISRFAYIKTGLGAHGDKAKNFVNAKPKEGQRVNDLWWPEEIQEYLSDERLEVAPGLVWCGEQNTLPTAVRPLSGMEVYTGRKSAIVPHVKLAMDSIASGKHEPTKFNYTTGTITLRNYIQKKAGLRAEFHHCYGGLLVEVDGDGDWFVRQLNADSEGTIYDLDLRVKDGEVTTGHRVEAITWGDVHVALLDPMVATLGWADQGMAWALRPRYQFIHDVLDFRSRSHHDQKDPHILFQRHRASEESVQAEVEAVAEFLINSKVEDCKTIVVDSNHHHHIGRWLKEQNGLRDPINARFWSLLQSEVYHHMEETGQQPNFLLCALKLVQKDIDKHAVFLSEDQSFIVCPDANGGIECGMHGDRGPNGSYGNPAKLARMGRKANTGHTHSAGIFEGVYTAGTCSILDPDYVRGPSSWSHSHIVTYPNGKRAIVTMWNQKWRAA